MDGTDKTLRETIAYTYAKLARAHAAVSERATSYNRTHHMIKAKLLKGLMSGSMSMRSLMDDERIKMISDRSCVYCGSKQDLSVDHLFPKKLGGTDEAENLVLCCRSCNSSKRDKDVFRWHTDAGRFPSVFVMRRYLKLLWQYAEEKDLLDRPISAIECRSLPCDLDIFPVHFPEVSQIKLTIPIQSEDGP